jgi:hypothetical protein
VAKVNCLDAERRRVKHIDPNPSHHVINDGKTTNDPRYLLSGFNYNETKPGEKVTLG